MKTKTNVQCYEFNAIDLYYFGFNNMHLDCYDNMFITRATDYQCYQRQNRKPLGCLQNPCPRRLQ